MPLCVPSEFIYYLVGDRIRDKKEGDRWDASCPELISELSQALAHQALPFLLPVDTLQDYVKMARKSTGNPHVPKTIAFALAREGHIEEAVAVIDEYLPQLDLTSHWQQDIANLSTSLSETLVANPSEAMRQLEVWEKETISSLGLEDFHQSSG